MLAPAQRLFQCRDPVRRKLFCAWDEFCEHTVLEILAFYALLLSGVGGGKLDSRFRLEIQFNSLRGKRQQTVCFKIIFSPGGCHGR